MEQSLQTVDKMAALKELETKVNQGLTYKEQAKNLLNIYLEKEKSGIGFNSIAADALILLYYIIGDYEEANQRRLKYKVCQTNEEHSNLFSIGKRFSRDPYCDVYGNILFFMRMNSIEISILTQILLMTYERDQAVFISKFYSKIKLATLKKLIGTYIQDQAINDYLAKYGWTVVDDYVITVPVTETIDESDLKNDLDFIGKMNVTLENVAKVNSKIKPVEI